MVFYYLREFSVENGFNKLSIEERLILSALLTKKLNGDERDLVEIIMNFDGNIDYTNYSSWDNYKVFADIISNFLAEAKGHISDYVIKYAEDRSLLHYISINYEDLKMHQKNSFSNIACKAFILGCANHSCNDNNNWFTFNIQKWNKFAMTHKKRTLEDIDKFMNDFNISYSVNGNKIIIDNKKKQIKNIEPIQVKEEKSIKEEIPSIPVNNEEIEETSILKEKEEQFLSVKELLQDMHKKLKEDTFIFDSSFINNIYKAKCIEGPFYLTNLKDESLSDSDRSLLLRKLEDKVMNTNQYIINNCKNLKKILNNEKLGDQWQEIKDNARIEQENLKIYIMDCLKKIYTYFEKKNIENIQKYFDCIIANILITHEKILTIVI